MAHALACCCISEHVLGAVICAAFHTAGSKGGAASPGLLPQTGPTHIPSPAPCRRARDDRWRGSRPTSSRPSTNRARGQKEALMSTTTNPNVRWFADLGLADLDQVGGKNSSL